MLTKPRLSLLEAPQGVGDRVRRAAIKAVFGFYPAAIHVLAPKTRLDRSNYRRLSRRGAASNDAWTKPEVELFASFVSYLNHCRF